MATSFIGTAVVVPHDLTAVFAISRLPLQKGISLGFQAPEALILCSLGLSSLSSLVQEG